VRTLIIIAVLVPSVCSAALCLYGGFGYSTSPWNDMSAMGFFFGAERDVNAVCLTAEYCYSDFDWDRFIYTFPEEHPVNEWVTHTVAGGVKYRFADYRVSPYVLARLGGVWYDYHLILFGGQNVVVNNPSLALSFGGGTEITFWERVGFFTEVMYDKHFTRVLSRYGDLGPDGDYEYSDVKYSGLDARAGLTIWIFG